MARRIVQEVTIGAEDYLATFANRLDRISDEWERGWTGEITDADELAFSRTVRGVAELLTHSSEGATGAEVGEESAP